jgi:hypothetical protein
MFKWLFSESKPNPMPEQDLVDCPGHTDYEACSKCECGHIVFGDGCKYKVCPKCGSMCDKVMVAARYEWDGVRSVLAYLSFPDNPRVWGINCRLVEAGE